MWFFNPGFCQPCLFSSKVVCETGLALSFGSGPGQVIYFADDRIYFKQGSGNNNCNSPHLKIFSFFTCINLVKNNKSLFLSFILHHWYILCKILRWGRGKWPTDEKMKDNGLGVKGENCSKNWWNYLKTPLLIIKSEKMLL